MTEYIGAFRDGLHPQYHNWRSLGLDLTCKRCFDEAFEYACKRLERFNVPDVWVGDVASTAIERALANFDPSYPTQSTAPFQSFLVTILHREALSQLRSEEARRNRNARWQTAQARLAATSEIEDVILDQELLEDVMQTVDDAWGRTRPELVEACWYWLQGLDTDEIAGLLGVSPRTVRRYRLALEEFIARRYAPVLHAARNA
jgi:RNA polymerase sigma factor (sigma-70 family)